MSENDPTDDRDSQRADGGRRTIDRRSFLQGAGAAALFGAAGAGLGQEAFQIDGLEPVEGADYIGSYPYREWEDLYREQWDWDDIARSTHGVNCTGSCSWNVYVKNGQVWREEQAADYPQYDDSLPDPNPRGCQKGACYTDYVNADHRVTHPLRRTGERGEGQWQQITWDEAFTEIAEKVIEEVQAGRYDAISGFTPIPAMSPVSFASGSRLIRLLGGVSHSFYDWYSDLPPGEPLTWGVQTDNAESADWYNADYLIAWGSNVNVTRIPDAKYFLEAAYEGTKRVGIFPDYSQTAIHCDEWLAPDPGSDIALALGMARTIVDEDLYDAAHLREQTDMPLLVREDTGKFLRAGEVGLAEDAGDPGKVFVMSDGDGGLRAAPGSLGNREGEYDPSVSIETGFQPRLDADTSVDAADGTVQVRTVWNRLLDELSNYGPEFVHEQTGVGTDTYQRVAREFAEVDRAKIIHGKGVNDWYHNDLGNRAIQLLVTLTGNLGRQGTGFDHYVGQEKIWTYNGWSELSFPVEGRSIATALWTFYHAGGMGNTDEDTRQRIEESIDRGWMPLYPEEREDGSRPDPSVMFIWRGNYFNQSKGGVAVKENLWPKLDLIVDVNFRMDSSALYSDIVLPAASHYEKHDLNMTDMHSYVIPFTPAIEPLGESRTDWQIFRGLAEKIQELAEERDLDPVPDRSFDREIDLTTIHDDYVRDHLSGEDGALAEDRAACEFILENSVESNLSAGEEGDEGSASGASSAESGSTNGGDETAGGNPEATANVATPSPEVGVGIDGEITFDDVVEQPRRLLTAGDHWTSEIEDGEAYTPWQRFVRDKEPWPTFTGRQQYYIDHDWFLELGEELPTHKDPVQNQDPEEYPLRYNTPHPRWSIHSTWRDNETMLRLQRGEPLVYLHPDDAAERGVSDGDIVRLYNDNDELEVQVKVYPSSEPGTARMYFAWERFQFESRGNFNTLVGMYMKPTQLIQYPEDSGEHLSFRPNYWGPTGVNSDVRVDVELVEEMDRSWRATDDASNVSGDQQATVDEEGAGGPWDPEDQTPVTGNESGGNETGGGATADGNATGGTETPTDTADGDGGDGQ
ncbi:molybdopterin-dependent oxidoreductase [Halomicrobium salinisoli]|uniref:molybdopterin-dependent oxidoreductase n=1 Tax=Halomicrobium salinisoli TaxID=2878391 RepID=UPI001CEFBC1B|nr:molybdopterin-dependent oxidoreductase [Halomicrobium salinisoli]